MTYTDLWGGPPVHRSAGNIMKIVPKMVAAFVGVTCILAAGLATAQSSNSVSFSFAPPPITELVGPDQSADRLNFTYLKVDVPGNPMIGIGMDFVGRRAGSGSGGLSFTLRGLGLTDEENTMGGGMFGGSVGPELYLGENRNTILFAGISMDFLAINMTGPFIDVRTTGLSLGLQIGAQHHFKLGDSVSLIPYVVLGTTNSSFSTTTEIQFGSSTSTSTSESTSSYTTTTLGFDMTVGDVSLGALANTGGDNDVTMIRLGFRF